MALNPRFAGQKFIAATNAKPLHTLELCETMITNKYV
jgi:pentose-5-phosphate-3-epimerase